MKKIILGLLLLLGLKAFAFPTPAEVEDIVNDGGEDGRRAAQLGTQITTKKVQVLRARYDYSVLGGSSSASLVLRDTDGSTAKLPANSIIKQVLIDVLVVPTAAGNGTTKISLGASNLSDLRTSTAASAWTTRLPGSPIGTAITMLKIGSTAAATVTANLLESNLNNGKFDVYIEYYLGRAN